MHAALLSLFMGVVLVGCGESGSAPPPGKAPPPKATPPAAPPAPKAPPPTPTLSARVFVDVSGSMAGFFNVPQADAGKLTAVHEELDAALSEAGLKSPQKCTVGSAVTCTGVPTAPAKLAARALYKEKTSRLDKVLERVPPPAQIDPNRPPAPDLLDDARVTLLVTDGMAVAPGGGGSSACASGADPACVRTLLEQRIEEGFGVWIVGVLLPFHGTHFPERALNPGHLKELRAHVDQLRFDPRNLGVAFEIPGPLGTDGASGSSTYQYKGYKPLLLFVFSRDAALGRGISAELVKKLRAAPIQPGKMRPEDTAHRVELAPLAARPTRAVGLEVAPLDHQRVVFGSGFVAAQFAELKLKEKQPFGDSLAVRVWCGPKGRAMLFLRYEQDGASALPPYFVEEVVLVPPANAPQGSVAPPSAAPVSAGPRQIQTGLNCAPISKGPDTPIDLSLETHLRLDTAQLDRQWWSQRGWSSEDAWQRPERVYRLEDIILPILKQRATRRIRAGSVALHVNRD